MTLQKPRIRSIPTQTSVSLERPTIIRSAGDSVEEQRTRVPIGPFLVDDLAEPEVVGAIVDGARSSRSRRPWITYALHVGGLNARHDVEYVRAMSAADLVYADGISVVLLARLAGATQVERCGTTDIGWEVLRQLSIDLGRRARVALLGGPDGLAASAGATLEANADVEVVFSEHGFHDDWQQILVRLALSNCDVVLLGFGAPAEMKWVEKHRDHLPPCLVMTCGGWFGFITGDERRAPEWARRTGLEWTFRLKQAPRRLGRRYAVGALSTASVALALVAERATHLPRSAT